MSKNKWWAKTLRIVGIILMSLTGAFTLMGGLGTSCVALKPKGFGPAFIKLASMQWLYILFVVVTTAIGIMGILAVIKLVKGRKNAYSFTLASLILGLVVGGIHMAVSRNLRGSSMPVDAVVYTTILTLVFFLIIRIPSIWAAVNFEKENDEGKESGGAAAIVIGFMILSIPYLMSGTHTIGGINYANVWYPIMNTIGSVLVVIGAAALFLPKKLALRKPVREMN
ncbi:hypothetical protein ACFLTX_03000 [Chloroflexota bacterium]